MIALTVVDVKITDLVGDWSLIAHSVWVILALCQYLYLLILFTVMAVSILFVPVVHCTLLGLIWACGCGWSILRNSIICSNTYQCPTLSWRLSSSRLWLGDCLSLSSGLNLLLTWHNEDIVAVTIKEIKCLAIDPYVIDVDALIEFKQILILFVSFCKLIWIDSGFLLRSRRWTWLVVLLLLR